MIQPGEKHFEYRKHARTVLEAEKSQRSYPLSEKIVARSLWNLRSENAFDCHIIVVAIPVSDLTIAYSIKLLKIIPESFPLRIIHFERLRIWVGGRREAQLFSSTTSNAHLHSSYSTIDVLTIELSTESCL